jgi:hypothetical protein
MVDAKQIEEFIMEQCTIIKNGGITLTQAGSLKYLMFGPQPSEQSLSIKMGKIGEEIIKKIIIETPHLELLGCGVQCIDNVSGKNKDLDLIWVDNNTNTIHYREVKGNLELDTEKLPATIQKMIEILTNYISTKYPGYNTDVAVFNWSIYNRNCLKKGISQIKKCENKHIKVEHPEDLFRLLNFDWDEGSYYEFFRKVGKYFSQE